MIRSYRAGLVSWSSFLFTLGALLLPAARADAALGATVVNFELLVQGDTTSESITLRVVAGDSTRIEVLSGTTVVGSFARSSFVAIRVIANNGNDTVLLSRANGEINEPARLEGGLGNDTLTGGAGNDVFFGGSGSDQIVWNSGDGSDAIDGEGDIDTLIVNGSSDDDIFGVAPNGPRVRITRTSDNASLNVLTTESINIRMHGGDDSVICGGNLAALIGGIRVEGGEGNDAIQGSNGVDVLLGENGDDDITGKEGNDVIFGGAGDDEMLWIPGDGNDTVEGEVGVDRLEMKGDNSSELFTINPNGARVALLRDVGSVTLDLNDIETIEVDGNAGFDHIAAAATLPDVTSLFLDGGPDADILEGSNTNDTFLGGAGADVINGRGGNDEITPGPGDDLSVVGGPGDDLFIWNDGDGVDGFDGEGGADRIQFNGSNANETVAINLDMGGVRVTRNAALALGFRAERIEFLTGAGADRLIVGANLATVTDVVADLGAGADTLDTIASSKVTANGNTEFDTLNFSAENQRVFQTPSTIVIVGATRVTHSNFEQINFLNSLTQPPTITITSPTANPSTTAKTSFITLAGTAADDTGIVAVSWNTSRFSEGSVTNGTTSWTAPDIPLAPGPNVIEVRVQDTSGNQTSDTLLVTVNELSYTMAEGATGGFFDTDVLLANPDTKVAPVTITYLKGDGTTVTQNLDLPPTSRTTIGLDGVAGLENAEVSTTVTSTNAVPLVVERTMRWDASGYGAHTERATDAPATTWYFAEGSQGFFETYVLLANPGAASNTATITFLLESGAPVVKTFTLAPTSRQTIGTNSISELLNQSFGIVVNFTQPGVAERAMYFSTPGTPIFNAGHESAGVDAPSTSWFLAEGATGSFFTTFVLLANPGTSDATATVTFLPATGQPVTKTHTVQAGRRLTLNIAAEDASLADAAVATQVTSTQPILVERAQYWPSTPDKWYEAHNSFGGTALGEKWGLAEGRVGGPEAYQTYILLANPDPTQTAQVTVTFLRTNGTTVAKAYAVGPTSRFNVHVNSMVPELANESFGAVIEVTDGPTIFVERALYSDSNGVAFVAGTNALATRLTPEPLHP